MISPRECTWSASALPDRTEQATDRQSASGTSFGQSNQQQLGGVRVWKHPKEAELEQAIALCSGHQLDRNVM